MILILQTIGALALLFAGGEALIRGASALAYRLGVTPLVVGLTVVALGTSAPELVVSLEAARAGSLDIAVGNVVGSNFANIALILGLSALVRPLTVQARTVRIDIPLMIGMVALLLGLFALGGVSRPAGGALLAILAGFVVVNLRSARRESAPVRDEFAVAAPARSAGAVGAAGAIVLGLAALVLGGRLLVGAAVAAAGALGVSESVIGLTIVAVGTSLPELVTSVLATARGHADLAVGNVVGSNIFNVAGILGPTALVHPFGRGGVGWFDLGAMAVACALLLPLAATGRRFDRREGALFLALYVAYTVVLANR